jgi:acyl-coenzyme A thioesterase PaaI-like protein
MFRDEEHHDRILGRLTPAGHHCGFPGLLHGGILYTALDCLAVWTATLLRDEESVVWVLRSAEVKYLRPAFPGQVLHLSGVLEERTEPWNPTAVRGEAKDEDGTLLVEGFFKLVPLTLDRFKKMARLREIPENWRPFVRNREGPRDR